MASTFHGYWSKYLRNIDFWLDGYRNMVQYNDLQWKLSRGSRVHWNVGVQPAGSFTRTISAIAADTIISWDRKWDHVIKVELNKEEAERRNLTVEMALALAMAEELGLLDQEECRRLKEAEDEQRYYSYGLRHGGDELRGRLQQLIHGVWIFKKLLDKRYLLVVDNLYEPLSFANLLGPPSWAPDSEWVISSASQHVLVNSMPNQHRKLYESFTDDEILMIILSALHQSAKYIFSEIHQGDERHWHRVALRCFHYTMLLFLQHSPPDHGDEDHEITTSPSPPYLTSGELIRQWAAQDILTITKQSVQQIIKEDTRSCQHNKYNDIYQVGNVILQTFQRYSLIQLPFSPATKANATKSAAHFLAFHGLIAESLPAIDKAFYEMEHKKWISLMDNKGWHISSEWLSQVTGGTTTLVLRHCSHIPSSLFSHPHQFLPKFACLRVLDLSYTPTKTLPPLIWCLPNLRMLSLKGCRGLERVPSLSDAERINLHFLDLSYSNINNFPLDFFQNMPNLHELLLEKCSNLVSLPPSIVALSSLKTLVLTSAQTKSFPSAMFPTMKHLQTLKLIDNKLLMSLPRSIPEAQGLEVLHIERCESIMAEEIILDGHHALRSILLIAAPHIKRLSLRGCRNLEFVQLKDLGVLEELDLSATAIKELPPDIPNLPQLRQLLLIGVPFLRRFPWHELRRAPDVLCLDHCADGNSNHFDKATQVRISDSRLFHSFNHATVNLVRDGRFLQSFYARVAPCTAKLRKIQGEESIVAMKLKELVQKKSPYDDVHHHYMAGGVNSIASMVAPPIRRTECDVEISSMDRRPVGLEYLLQVTKSIFVTCDASIPCLSDLSRFDELEECELRGCHQMEVVFGSGTSELKNLRNVRGSNLKGLDYFYNPYRYVYPGDPNFSALEHLHLEYCPRLEAMLPCQATLPSLETLDVMFCYNLKTIFFATWSAFDISYYQLPRLRRIRLQELPQLQHLHDDDDAAATWAPAWKELHVRGCWSLRRLPRFAGGQPSKVEVSGERAWWAKLRWDDGSQHGDGYEPKLPPEFASLDERAKAESYLR